MAMISRADKSVLGQWWWTVDKTILMTILVLSVFGLGLVMTASPAVAERIGFDTYHFVVRHVLFLAPCLGAMIVLSFVQERTIWRVSALLLMLSIVGIFVSLAVGTEIKGAQRWIKIAGFSLQPSEFMKPAFLVASAWLMARQREKEGFHGLYMSFGLLVFCVALLIAQPDLGMTVLLCSAFCVQLFLFGSSLRYFVLLGGLGIVGLVGAHFTLDHVQSRIDRFLNPASGDNYQVERSIESFANGGLMGTGPGQGTVKLQLPDAHADFIFSVAGEELGFIFTFVLIGLYAFILWRGMRVLARGSSVFGMLAGGALLALVAIQSFIHMGSAMHLIPAKGMTLPLVSYGGSSMLALGFTFGVILAVTRKTGQRMTDYD